MAEVQRLLAEGTGRKPKRQKTESLIQRLHALNGHEPTVANIFQGHLMAAAANMRIANADDGKPELEVRFGLVLDVTNDLPRRLFPSAAYKVEDQSTWPVDVGRIGIESKEFRSGVSSAVLNVITQSLTLPKGEPPIVTHEIDVMHREGDVSTGKQDGSTMGSLRSAADQKQRTTFSKDDLGGVTLKERIQKTRVQEPKDFALRSSRYDIRFGVGCEKRLEPLNGEAATNLYLKALRGELDYREKQRKSFRPQVNFNGTYQKSAWKVDCTWVFSTRNGTEVEPSYEVELELGPSATDALVRTTNEEDLANLCRRFAFELDAIILALNPRQEAGLEDLQEVGEDVRERVLSTLDSALRASNRTMIGGNSFPGAMPVSLSRRGLNQLQRSAAKDPPIGGSIADSPYLCAEKTDGVRYLLVVTAAGEAAFVDRKMRMYIPPGGIIEVGGCFNKGVVIDGELVICRQRREPHAVQTFLAFDLLSDGMRGAIMNESFSERHRILRDSVAPPAEQNLRRVAEQSGGERPVTFRVKTFYRIRDLSNLLSFLRVPRAGIILQSDTLFPRRREILTCPQLREGEREYLRHLTDGIIFAKNSSYLIGTDETLMKWKFPDTVSIDLKVAENAGDPNCMFQFMTFDAQREDVHLPGLIRLHASDVLRLRVDAHLQGRKQSIVELAADSETGEWVYCGLRPDKGSPNFFGTVIATLQEVGSGLDQHELLYRLVAPSPTENDWTHHLTRSEKKIVEWKTEEKDKSRKRHINPN